MPLPASAAPLLHTPAEGIHAAAIPTPFRGLGPVNAYLLQGANGWTLVDTGLQTPDAVAAWQAVFAELGIGFDALEQIVLTHHHPDHMGFAGMFQAMAAEAGRDVPVRISRREADILDLVWTDRDERDDVLERFFHRCGAPDAAETTFAQREIDAMRETLTPFAHYTFLEAGDAIRMGERTFEALAAPGHSDGQLVFFDRSDGVTLCGDHVLPHITANISEWPDVEPDPLGRYLDSLAAMADLPVSTALPGHGAPFTTWRARIASLRAHHAERLDAAQAAVQGGRTVWEAAESLFALGRLDRHQTRMAVTETLAHLSRLAAAGRVHRRDADDVWRYHA